jgi:hypothetical protein
VKDASKGVFGFDFTKRFRRVDVVDLPKHRSTYRIGPPLRGRAQASSAETSAIGRHLKEGEKLGWGGDMEAQQQEHEVEKVCGGGPKPGDDEQTNESIQGTTATDDGFNASGATSNDEEGNKNELAARHLVFLADDAVSAATAVRHSSRGGLLIGRINLKNWQSRK